MDGSWERTGIAVIRGIAMDAPHAARSGHQGTAMALAPLAHVLWTRLMRYDAGAPEWFDRDRFILSAGHASILQYTMLYLTGHGLTLDDLRRFRQWGSRTPGHPEAGHTPGVEVTTGPLGQGFANAVGMAIAEEHLRARLGPDLCDHRTWVICSDGDLMEGISHEAASLAGHLRLGRLIAVYDDNRITIDGPTDLTFTEDVAARFRAYGWHVLTLGEVGEDLDALTGGLREAAAVEDRPSLVIIRTHVAEPSPTWRDRHEAHGNPFDDETIAETKRILGIPPDATFWVPDDVLDAYRRAGRRAEPERRAWEERAAAVTDPVRRALLEGRPLEGWADRLPSWEAGEEVATRAALARCLGELTRTVPPLVAGAADLTGNTGARLADDRPFSATDRSARQIYFGVREHAMGAAANGMALHGGVRPVVGTFFVFSDYLRPALRLAALSGARVVWAFSHDSIGVGEDGPTHQPVEHLPSVRAVPDLVVIRPADANETAAAVRVALSWDGPVALVLTRQKVPVLPGTAGAPVDRGAYVLVAPAVDPHVVLVGTGSEVQLCVEAASRLADDGVAAQVVSMPSWELFDRQDEHWRHRVLPPGVPTLAVEAAAPLGWERWADDVIGVDRFGASAPGAEVMRRYGFTVDHVTERARALVALERTAG